MGTKQTTLVIVSGLTLLSCFCGLAAGSIIFSAGISIYQSMADIQITALDITSVVIAPQTQTPVPTFTLLPTYTIIPTSTSSIPTVISPIIITREIFTESPTFTSLPSTEKSIPSPVVLFETPSTVNIAAHMLEIGCDCNPIPGNKQSDKNCTYESFETFEDANNCYKYCIDRTGRDVYGLDKDNNGRICEDGLK